MSSVVEILTSLCGCGSESNRRTVHVHLAISNLVEPSPGESRCTGWQGGRNREGVSIRIDGGGIFPIIALDVLHGTSSLDRVDDLECAGLGRCLVVSDGDLAGSTAVDGGSKKLKGLGRSESHGV